eukprot:PhM_4_TR13706/c1_g1_i1/m.85628/K15109/SLC25A20_29, CACT, CACL, CRC1; solute carrier family 25 (mitochondrial carnitine/acylcarnitine transporter), member 20/29
MVTVTAVRKRVCEDDLPFLQRAERRFITGWCGGICYCSVLYPFDTVKARMQLQSSPYRNIWHCAKDIWKKEGFRGFYRGVSMLYGVYGTLTAILFFAQYAAKEFLKRNNVHLHVHNSVLEGLSALLASPVYAAALTPIEVLKTRMQTNTVHGKCPSLTSALRDTVMESGVSSLYKGYLAVCTQRVIGLPVFFGAYGFVKSKTMTHPDPNHHYPMSTRVLTAILGGSLGGILFWTVCYPADLIKTKIQTAPKNHPKLSIRDVVSSTYKSGGLRAFYRGISACYAHSIPSNSSFFLGTEIAMWYFFNDGAVE